MNIQFFLSSLCSFLQNALFFLFGEKKTQTEKTKNIYHLTLKTHHIKSTFIQRQQHKEEEENNNNTRDDDACYCYYFCCDDD